jgi:hypothetical protein
LDEGKIWLFFVWFVSKKNMMKVAFILFDCTKFSPIKGMKWCGFWLFFEKLKNNPCGYRLEKINVKYSILIP